MEKSKNIKLSIFVLLVLATSFLFGAFLSFAPTIKTAHASSLEQRDKVVFNNSSHSEIPQDMYWFDFNSQGEVAMSDMEIVINTSDSVLRSHGDTIRGELRTNINFSFGDYENYSYNFNANLHYQKDLDPYGHINGYALSGYITLSDGYNDIAYFEFSETKIQKTNEIVIKLSSSGVEVLGEMQSFETPINLTSQVLQSGMFNYETHNEATADFITIYMQGLTQPKSPREKTITIVDENYNTIQVIDTLVGDNIFDYISQPEKAGHKFVYYQVISGNVKGSIIDGHDEWLTQFGFDKDNGSWEHWHMFDLFTIIDNITIQAYFEEVIPNENERTLTIIDEHGNILIERVYDIMFEGSFFNIFNRHLLARTGYTLSFEVVSGNVYKFWSEWCDETHQEIYYNDPVYNITTEPLMQDLVINDDVVVRAVYTLRQYQIIYQHFDQNWQVIYDETITLNYGDIIPELPFAPLQIVGYKANERYSGYFTKPNTLAGELVNGGFTYSVTYEQIVPIYYSVKFYANTTHYDQLVAEFSIHEGFTVSNYPEAPEKILYNFSHWELVSGDPNNATSDIIFHAVYKERIYVKIIQDIGNERNVTGFYISSGDYVSLNDIADAYQIAGYDIAHINAYASELDFTYIDIDAPITQRVYIFIDYASQTSYLITFLDKNGIELHSQLRTTTSLIAPPTAPSIEGYTFSHWQLIAGNGVVYDYVIDNATFKAIYNEIPKTYYSVTIKFLTKNSFDGTGELFESETYQIEKGTTLYSHLAFEIYKNDLFWEQRYYSFKANNAEYKLLDFRNGDFNNFSLITADIELYAFYIITYDTLYIVNYYDSGFVHKQETYYESFIGNYKVEKVGCDFKGWHYLMFEEKTINETTSFGYIKRPTKEYVLVAEWNYVYYDITYIAYYGEQHANKIKLFSADAIEVLELTARKDSYKSFGNYPYSYKFLGWQKENGEFLTAGEYATSNMTLYAKFELVEHVVRFYDLDNNLVFTQIVVHGENPHWVEHDPKLYGYAQRGWATQELLDYANELGYFEGDPRYSMNGITQDFWHFEIIENDTNYYLIVNKNLVQIKITYWTLERFEMAVRHVGPFNSTLFLDEFFLDVVVKRTRTWNVPAGVVPNFDEMLGVNQYGIVKYKTIQGFEFIRWDNGTDDLLPSPTNNHYEAIYNFPKIKIDYYNKNGKLAETQYIDPVFVPVDAVTLNWIDGFEKYLNDIFVKFSLIELFRDIISRARVECAVENLSAAYTHGSYEIYYLTAQPNIRQESLYGIFGSAAAGVQASTFTWLGGSASNNDFVYIADFEKMYVSGMKYEMIITFDSAAEKIIHGAGDIVDEVVDEAGDVISNIGKTLGDVLGNLMGSLGAWFWVIIAVIIAVIFMPILLPLLKIIIEIISWPFKVIASWSNKRKKKNKREQYQKNNRYKGGKR